MEKNRLDEFFKKKLDHRSFEPSDDFWKEAEAMIEAQESDERNWKYFWWSLGLFMLIGAAITWFNWDRWNPANQQQSANDTIELSQNTNESTTIDNKTLTTTEIEENKKEEQGKELDTTKNKLANSNNQQNNENNNQQGNPNSNASQTTNKNALTTNINTNSVASQKRTPSDEIEIQPKKYISTASEKESNNSTTETNNLKSEFNSPKNNSDVSITIKDQNTQKDFANATPFKEEDIAKISPSGQIKNEDSTEGKPKVETREYQNNTILLSTLQFTTDVPERLLELGNPTPYKSDYPLPRRRRFNLGFQAGISLFPAGGDEKMLTGYEAGLTAKYQIGRQWSVGADVLFVRNTGTFDTIGTAVETVYGFGKETTAYRLERSNLNFIEIPIYAQYKIGKHLLEGGVGFNYLMGVRGGLETTRSLFPWERSDRSMFEETTTGEETWITKNGFPNLHTNAFLGYRFQLSKRLDLGVRTRFVFYKNQTNTTLTAEEEKVSYKELRPITFRVNLRYYFVK